MDLNKQLDELLKRVKFASGLKLDQIEKRLLLSKGRLSNVKSKGQVTERLLKTIENEFKEELTTIDKRSVGDQIDTKTIDLDETLAHSVIQLKAMLRVSLRYQAEIISKQTGRPLKAVLTEINKALKAESSDEFDAL